MVLFRVHMRVYMPFIQTPALMRQRIAILLDLGTVDFDTTYACIVRLKRETTELLQPEKWRV